MVSLKLTFLFTILTLLSIQSFADLITTTCKETPNPRLCVSTLRSNPKSANADTGGLAIIMVAAIKSKATKTLQGIKKLNPGMKKAISECSLAYKMMLEVDIPEAFQALPGVPKFAEDGIKDSALEAQDCGNSLQQYRVGVADMNKGVHDLCVVALAIIRMLL